MKIEEAVKWMEEAIQETTECFEECSPALQKELIEQKEVFELAITALRSMPEAGEPLSLEQLRERWKGCDSCKAACWNCSHKLLCCEDNDKECHYCFDQSMWEYNNYRDYCPSMWEYNNYRNYCPDCGRPLTEEAWVELERRLRG